MLALAAYDLFVRRLTYFLLLVRQAHAHAFIAHMIDICALKHFVSSEYAPH